MVKCKLFPSLFRVLDKSQGAIVLLALFAIIIACDPIEEEISRDPNLVLTYSTDTIRFDTLLTERGSITKRMRVFNPNDNAIELDRVALGKNSGSDYTITVNGQKGKEIEEEVIFGGDSLLILVEVFIDPLDEDLPFLVKDSILIEYNGTSDNVKLVAWGQDAVFFNREVIECDAVWTSTRPYVLSDTVLIGEGCTLTVEEGTRILIDNNSALAVIGSLQIQGTANNKVTISNTRFDDDFEVAPGQWNAILFLEGSFDNVIDHAIIKNGIIGLRLGTPDEDEDYDLTVSNTTIAHMSSSGILAFSSDLYVYNTEIYNCQTELTGNYLGGNYTYEHCTFSNQPSLFIRDEASVRISDNIVTGEGTLTEPLTFSMTNSIIWGGEDEEILLSLTGNVSAEVEVNNNIIKTEDTFWEDLGNVISQEDNYPGFYLPAFYNYQLDSVSNARDQAIESNIEYDLLGTLRDELPDLGAYERKDSIP